ncbi:unnamed protein product [Orchesella dallaii]|uniref:Uncharacterized protein n=1 Tax=Orchesella dallaii TaxID=48710 RepID=A0ABP1QK78_9HEXA
MVQETMVKAENLKVKLNAYIAQMKLFESMIKEKYNAILNARIKRDTIKNDAMRSRTKFRFYLNQKFELLLNNKDLRREADKQKIESVQIRKEFEKATNTDDEMAINYRVRTEVFIFHEYIYC